MIKLQFFYYLKTAMGFAALAFGAWSGPARVFYFLVPLSIFLDGVVFIGTAIMLAADKEKEIAEIHALDLESRKKFFNRFRSAILRTSHFSLLLSLIWSGWYIIAIAVLVDSLTGLPTKLLVKGCYQKLHPTP